MAGFAAEAARWRGGAERAATGMARDMAEGMGATYIAVLKSVTPVRSGELRGSEKIDSISGGGTHAVARGGPHTIYAQFRNDGGEISSHGPWSLSDGSSYFGRHVHQTGAHYMEKAQAAAQGPCSIVAARVVDVFVASL